MSIYDSWSDDITLYEAEYDNSKLHDLKPDTLRINLAAIDEIGGRLHGFERIVLMLGDRELSYTPDEVVAALEAAKEAMP